MNLYSLPVIAHISYRVLKKFHRFNNVLFFRGRVSLELLATQLHCLPVVTGGTAPFIHTRKLSEKQTK